MSAGQETRQNRSEVRRHSTTLAGKQQVRMGGVVRVALNAQAGSRALVHATLLKLRHNYIYPRQEAESPLGHRPLNRSTYMISLFLRGPPKGMKGRLPAAAW